MADATALSLSQFFSELTSQHVSFSMAAYSSPSNGEQLFGLYQVVADATPLLLRIGLKSFALMGGALTGIPADLAVERVLGAQVDEPLRDAMHEVLNIASTGFSPDARIVFQRMERNKEALPANMKLLMQTAAHRSAFRLSIDGSAPELLTLIH